MTMNPETKEAVLNILNKYKPVSYKDSPDTVGIAYEYDDAVEMLTEAIECYHKAEWVSVEDRFPPLTKNVLLYSIDRGIEEVTKGRMNVDNRFWTMCGMQLFNVTHWMPLPTPPKQD